MATRPDPFRPYETPGELSRGRRRALVYLAVAVGAAVLAVVADRLVDEPRLVTTYVAACVLHALGSVGPIARWARTPELAPAD